MPFPYSILLCAEPNPPSLTRTIPFGMRPSSPSKPNAMPLWIYLSSLLTGVLDPLLLHLHASYSSRLSHTISARRTPYLPIKRPSLLTSQWASSHTPPISLLIPTTLPSFYGIQSENHGIMSWSFEALLALL